MDVALRVSNGHATAVPDGPYRPSFGKRTTKSHEAPEKRGQACHVLFPTLLVKNRHLTEGLSIFPHNLKPGLQRITRHPYTPTDNS